jgi:hypothetical protein
MHSAINFNRAQRLYTYVLLVAGFSLFPCSAQEGAKVSLTFVTFPRNSDAEPLELLIGEAKSIEIEAPSNEISKTHLVPARSTWTIGKMVTGDDGKAKFEVYGKTKALTSSRQLLLLIRKGQTNADGFDIIAIDSRKAEFGGEKFLFLNASKVAIAGKIGKEKIALKPGSYKVIKPKPDRGVRKNLCHVSFAYGVKKEWKVFSSTIWPVHKNARALVFFYQDPSTKRLRLHAIRDFM